MMNAWQAWLLFGLPLFVLAFAMLIRPTTLRFGLGLGALFLGAVGMMYVDPVSAAVFGVSIALAVASGVTEANPRTENDEEKADALS